MGEWLKAELEKLGATYTFSFSSIDAVSKRDTRVNM